MNTKSSKDGKETGGTRKNECTEKMDDANDHNADVEVNKDMETMNYEYVCNNETIKRLIS